MTITKSGRPSKSEETGRKKFDDSNYYSFRRLIAGVIAGTESGTELAEKLKPYVFETEEDFSKMLTEEQNKKRLIDLLANCTGITIESYSKPQREDRDYDVYISIRYEDAEAFVRHHENVKDVIQQVMNQDKQVASVYQTIKSTHIRAGGSFSDNKYEVVLEG